MNDCNCNGSNSQENSTDSLINNNLSICFFTILEPGNAFDNTRQGLVTVNGQNLKLDPIQTTCKCQEQESATLAGPLFWTVSIPIRSDCAPLGNNAGFQSVSGTQIINQTITGDLSNFNSCNISAKLVEIIPHDPCAPDFQSDGQPVVGTFIFMPNVN